MPPAPLGSRPLARPFEDVRERLDRPHGVVLPIGLPATRPDEEIVTRRIPPYNVVLHNDDDHSVEFVEEVLRKVLGCVPERAFQLMHEAHTTGRAVIWMGPKEGAELKAEQMTTYHETRVRDDKKLGPLTVTIEPAPGG